MRPPRIGQWIVPAHSYRDGAVGDRVEHLSGPPGELVLGADEVHQAWPGQRDRSGRTEPLRVDRRHRSTGRAEQGQGAPDGEAGKAGVERGPAHPVIGRGDAMTVGQLADLCAEPGRVLGVVQHLDGSGLPR